MAAAKKTIAFFLHPFSRLLRRRKAKKTRKTKEKKKAFRGRTRKAKPQNTPVDNPSPKECLRRNRKRNRRKSVLKNRLEVWDIIVEDITRNQGLMAPRRAARRPTDRL
jgi:hypothetical protein